MKKTFRLICMGLIALTMGCNFTACSSDDDDNNGNTNGNNGGSFNGNRLMSITEEGPETKIFEYDNTGRIVKITFQYPEEGASNEITTYQYSDSKIVKIENGDDDDVFYIMEYTLTDGKITRLKETKQINGRPYNQSETTYTYNGNHLIRVYDGYSNNEVRWDGNNITSIGTYQYTYTDIDASAGWNEYWGEIDDVLYNEGYFGQKSKNLYKSKGFSGDMTEFNYDMSNGKVIRRISKNGDIIIYSWK